MNEIITKLNEIEEKANAILLDAGNDRDQQMARLSWEKQEIDARYDRLEQEHAQAVKEQLLAKAHRQTQTAREETQAACERLLAYYGDQRERLAEEIMQRVTRQE